ncbi:MAG: hypothetical protein RLZZ612_2572 [Pseudomonadota bacterium]|jgi:signal transduction histidine kinase/DNA-binding response OmpR family regulator
MSTFRPTVALAWLRFTPTSWHIAVVLVTLLGALAVAMLVGRLGMSPDRAGQAAIEDAVVSIHTQFAPAGPLATTIPTQEGKPTALPVSLGWQERNLWLRVQLKLPTNEPELWLELAPPRLTQVRFHQKGTDGQWTYQDNGAVVPVDERVLGVSRLLFPLNVQGRTDHEVWIEVRSRSPLHLGVMVHKPKLFTHLALQDFVAHILMLGALGVLGSMAVLMAVVVNQSLYWWLAVRVLLVFVWMLQQMGVSALVLPNAWVAVVGQHGVSLAQATLASVLFLCWVFLRDLGLPKWGQWGYGLLAGVSLLVALVDATGLKGYPFVGPATIYLNLAVHLWTAAASVYLIWRGRTLAVVVLIGALTALLFYVPVAKALLGLEVTRVVREAASPLPTLITGFLFFVGILLHTMRERAAAKQEIVQHKYAQVQELERLVAQRTALLHTATERAQQLNASKSIFLAKVSHELRTPMHAVLGYIDLSLRENVSARTRSMLQVAHTAGQQLLTQIGDLLDFTRLEREQLRLMPDRMSLQLSLDAVIHATRLIARERGNRFTPVLDDDVPNWILADQRRLEQVLMILLVNACRYTRLGHIQLRVSKAQSSASADASDLPLSTLRFEVSDTGRGISPEALGRIFNAFERGDAVEGDGMGLGLNIAQQLLGLMGTQLEVSSTVGVGSSFAFALRVRVLTHEQPLRDAEQATFGGYSGPRRRILVLDDVATNREYLHLLLTEVGFTVELAADAKSAWDRIAQLERTDQHIDLCIIDQCLSEQQTGWMFAAQLHAHTEWRTCSCPLLMLSSTEPSQPEAIGARGTGSPLYIDQFLLRPVPTNTLLLAVARLLQLDWQAQPQSVPPTATDRTDADSPIPTAIHPTASDWQRLQQHAKAGDVNALEQWVQQFPAAGHVDLDRMVWAMDFDGIARHAGARATSVNPADVND